MLWLTIAIVLLLSILAIGYVVWPLWRATTILPMEDDNPLVELIQRKDTVLLSIKELEFDYQTGKLSADDYARLDQRLRQQAISLLRQLEKDAPDSPALEAELEAAILRHRQHPDQPPNPAKLDDGKAQPLFCTHCGSPILATNNFCAKCGTPVRKMATVEGQ